MMIKDGNERVNICSTFLIDTTNLKFCDIGIQSTISRESENVNNSRSTTFLKTFLKSNYTFV
jgi:hypothetical protein